VNYGDLQTEVFQRIEESESDPEFWELAEVKEALNDGWMDLARHTGWCKRTVLFALQDDTSYYNLLDLCPEEPVSVDALWDLTTKRWFGHVTVDELETKTYYRWEAVDGTASCFFVRGFWLGVFPYPTVSDTQHNSELVRLHFTAIPRPLGPDDYNIPFRELELPLILYALYDLKSQEGEDEIALDFWNKYVVARNKVKSWVRGHYGRGIERRHRALDE
jgi:hypothetical protein